MSTFMRGVTRTVALIVTLNLTWSCPRHERHDEHAR